MCKKSIDGSCATPGVEAIRTDDRPTDRGGSYGLDGSSQPACRSSALKYWKSAPRQTGHFIPPPHITLCIQRRTRNRSTGQPATTAGSLADEAAYSVAYQSGRQSTTRSCRGGRLRPRRRRRSRLRVLLGDAPAMERSGVLRTPAATRLWRSVTRRNVQTTRP